MRYSRVANPPASYRSLSGPLGPKSQKNLKKVSRGGLAKSLEKVLKMSVRYLFETFPRLFGTPGPEAPGDFFFFRFFWDFGPGGPGRLL